MRGWLVEIGQGQRGLLQPGVAGRQRRHQRFGEDANLGEFRPVDGRAQQPDIDAAGQQRFGLFGAHHLLQRNVHIGQPRGADADQARQEAVAGGGGESQGDGAGLARRGAPRGQGGAFGQPQDAPRLQQEDPARRGQLHHPAGAVQQLDPQHPFQQLDLPRQGRLGHVDPRGGPAEMQLLGRRHKAAQLPQFKK